MADTKISALTSVAPADGDYLSGVDISDTTQSANGTTKRFTFTNIWTWILGKLASVAADIVPDANGTRSLGASGTRYATVHANAVNFAGTTVDANIATFDIAVALDNGSSALSTGVWTDFQVNVACTIQSVTLLADASGSVVIDIWKDTYANYPPTVADTITASAKPTISSATKATDSTLTGWTTSISAGDTLRFNVDSATTIKRVTVILKVKRT